MAEGGRDEDIYAAVDEIMTICKKDLYIFQECLPRFKALLAAKQLGKLLTK